MDMNIQNFFKQNTPKIAQTIGDISLICAGVASLPMLLSASGVAVPAVIVTASIYATSLGGIVKTISKMFGNTTEPTEQPK